ncbi:MAG: hypothetical protein RLZZ574_168, partial [Cyanobacteriota bacterium]
YDPVVEVVIVGIGEGQLKLINFQPKITPAECFTAMNSDIDGLIISLETALVEYIKVD